MDNGPTYAQLGRIGHWLGDLTNRIESELQAIQSRGPTRISGMDLELDRAAEAAIRKWAGELIDGFAVSHGPFRVRVAEGSPSDGKPQADAHRHRNPGGA